MQTILLLLFLAHTTVMDVQKKHTRKAKKDEAKIKYLNNEHRNKKELLQKHI